MLCSCIPVGCFCPHLDILQYIAVYVHRNAWHIWPVANHSEQPIRIQVIINFDIFIILNWNLMKYNFLSFHSLPLVHRRRIYTEDKAKVVAAVWGTEYFLFNSLPRYLFSTRTIKRIGLVHHFLHIILV